MGLCCCTHRTNVIIPTDGTVSKVIHPSIVEDHYQVMISYALPDQAICHQLANYLVNEGFHIWFDRTRTQSHFYESMTKVIDNSDCIMLCLSEDYAENYRCQREARYASDMHQKIIMVKVNSKYQLKDWLSFIKPGEIQFELSNNKSKFKKVCSQIVQELHRHTKPSTFIFARSLTMTNSSSTDEGKFKQNTSTILFQKLIQRRGHLKTGVGKDTYVWVPITGCIGTAVRTEGEMNRRYQLDTNLSLMTKRRQQLSFHFDPTNSTQLCLFAERMRQNTIEWEKFCKK